MNESRKKKICIHPQKNDVEKKLLKYNIVLS